MAKKYYANLKFETKEDFEKHYYSIYNPGYESGYEDGMTEAVSYIFELLDHFPYDMQQMAAKMEGDRQKKTAMKNRELGIIPYVPDDPNMRDIRKQQNRMMSFNTLIRKVAKEIEENSKES